MRKSYTKLTVKIFIILTLVYFALAVLSGVFFSFLLPQQYFGLYPEIWIFYWVTGVLLNTALNHTRKNNPDRLFNVFMMARMIKFLLTIAFLVIHVSIWPESKIVFAISLMVNYIIYGILEIYIYYLYNKKVSRNVRKK